MGKPGSSVFRALHNELTSSMLPIIASSGSNLEGSPSDLLLEANGSDGSSGTDGSAGGSASIPGKDGSPGLAATHASCGSHGGSLHISLSTVDDNDNEDNNNDVPKKRQMVQISATVEHDERTSGELGPTVLHDKIYSLQTLPSVIEWCARGGTGGHGANGGAGGDGAIGVKGVNASANHEGFAGQRGGNGGDGGEGTSGANGGAGGQVTIQVKEKDAFLLMLLQPCDLDDPQTASRLKGGTGGRQGAHGAPGEGGEGGPGGESFIISSTDADGKPVKRTISGGRPGPDGIAGASNIDALQDGTPGAPGTFQICISSSSPDKESPSNTFYTGRYDLQFTGKLELKGAMPREEGDAFEFGDIITLQNVQVMNSGKAPLPTQQRVDILGKFGLPKDGGGDGMEFEALENQLHLPPHSDILAPGQTMTCEGQLQFTATAPDPPLDQRDMDPMVQRAGLLFQAFQLGPPCSDKGNADACSSDFERPYSNFHPKSAAIPIEFRHVAHNTSGIETLQSLHPGEVSAVHFDVTNIGSYPIGGHDDNDGRSVPRRRLAVRYFLQEDDTDASNNDAVAEEDVRFCLVPQDGRTAADLADEFDSLLVETSDALLDLPTIGPHQTHTATALLSLTETVKPYCRAAFQVELLLQDLPETNLDTDDSNVDGESQPAMRVVQRRFVELVSEPLYEQKDGAPVVLITSCATTCQQYNMWMEILAHGFGIEVEVFSISRYGTFDPNFSPWSDGITLQEAFSGKLVIVLNDKFQCSKAPSPFIYPTQLLHAGCMEQASGFEPSTKWLIAGDYPGMSRQLLDEYLFCRGLWERKDFDDVASYKAWLLEKLAMESKYGRVEPDTPLRCDTIRIDTKHRNTSAHQLRDWLIEKDRLRQYTVEYESPSPAGAPTDDNTTTSDTQSVVSWTTSSSRYATLHVYRGFCRTLESAVVLSTDNMTAKDAMQAVAEAMPRVMRVPVYCEAIRTSGVSLTALRNAFVTDFIRDVLQFLDGNMHVNYADLEISFPTIGTFLASPFVTDLIEDSGYSREASRLVRTECSELYARFALVANSKDLRPRFMVAPGFKKKKETKNALGEVVERLRLRWKTAVDMGRVEEIQKDLKVKTKSMLFDSDAKKTNARVGTRWLRGVNHLHSTSDGSSERTSVKSRRLLEQDQEAQGFKIARPLTRSCSTNQKMEWIKAHEIRLQQVQQTRTFVQENRRRWLLNLPFDSRSEEEVKGYIREFATKGAHLQL